MPNQFNPFKDNRAEQMRDLWKYYVPFPGLDSGGKPLVIEGGRGSGKTMFFQCNSWRQVLSQIKKNNSPTTDLFEQTDFIGIYYRVDTTFVSSMKGHENVNWNSFFETYLSICIFQEVLDLLQCLTKDIPVSSSELATFISTYAKRFNPSSCANSIEAFRQETGFYLDYIEDIINGIHCNTQLRFVNMHRLINDICISCGQLFQRELLFKIFIDEYETLQMYQQKIVNTLIKHSTLPAIFNIGLRPGGMKTPETISITETIEAPHDYEALALGIDTKTYSNLLEEICKKRILLAKEKHLIPEHAPEDIRYYLGMYKIDDEIQRLTSSTKKPPFFKDLEEIIFTIGTEEKLTSPELDVYLQELCYNAPVINARLHYALLCKKTQYTPSLKTLFKAYKEQNKRYTDWMHNRGFGLVFLLCKEYKKEKMYYGFDVYTSLSSGIVRYFLELCEQAFRITFLDEYNWDTPISPDIQTEAAKCVSEYKVTDIASYEPYGKELRIFTQYLGQIFYKLHTDRQSTLGEPEPNHFSTKDLSLSPQLKELIASAIMWNVLQEGEPTKRKQAKLSPETVDYYMNKIYIPYFGISYRNQRKLTIETQILDGLFSGDEKMAKSAFQKYFRLVPKSNPRLANEEQLSLFDYPLGGKL